MPLSNTTFSNDTDPVSKLDKVLSLLDSTTVEVKFFDKNGRPVVDRAMLEMVLEDYAQATQDATVFNKWLQLDTKFDKSLREYKSDIKLLIASISSRNQAQSALQNAAPDLAPAGTPPESDMGRPLPTN